LHYFFFGGRRGWDPISRNADPETAYLYCSHRLTLHQMWIAWRVLPRADPNNGLGAEHKADLHSLVGGTLGYGRLWALCMVVYKLPARSVVDLWRLD